MKLKASEMYEATAITLGRLKTAIKYGTKERQLALFEKIANDYYDLTAIKYGTKERQFALFEKIANDYYDLELKYAEQIAEEEKEMRNVIGYSGAEEEYA